MINSRYNCAWLISGFEQLTILTIMLNQKKMAEKKQARAHECFQKHKWGRIPRNVSVTLLPLRPLTSMAPMRQTLESISTIYETRTERQKSVSKTGEIAQRLDYLLSMFDQDSWDPGYPHKSWVIWHPACDSQHLRVRKGGVSGN